ncbi:MAG: LysR family transcriptional regulator, partial [Acinetobacter sp.]|nr:LysR family transcriptional regulator [Acinetobacter sp.]
AVYPSRRGLLPAVRVFIDYLVEQLTQCSTKKRPG